MKSKDGRLARGEVEEEWDNKPPVQSPICTGRRSWRISCPHETRRVAGPERKRVTEASVARSACARHSTAAGVRAGKLACAAGAA